MGLLYSVLLGALAGWLAGKLTRGSGFGALRNIIIGIVGGMLGGWMFKLLGLQSDGSMIGQLVTSVVGALALLFLLGKTTKK